MNSGIINVLKPAGITSNYVLNQIKKKLHPKKIGHLGTLDPSGVGVLPVCINKGTKLFDYFMQKDKTYKTVFVFGKETDTLDSDGQVTKTDDVDISNKQILSVLPKLIGIQDQLPPNYSAKKIDGKKAYELARNGIEFELKPKKVNIFDIKLVKKLARNTFLFEIECSSGTYIRSIVRDMAKLLDTVGYVGAIIRTKSGFFHIENAIQIDEIDESKIISLKNVLQNAQKVFVSNEFYDKIINGNRIEIDCKDITNCIVFCKEQLMGIADVKNGVLKVKTSLWEKND